MRHSGNAGFTRGERIHRILSAPVLLVLLAALSFPSPAPAFYEAESADGSRSVEAVGSLRLTGAYLDAPDLPVFYANERDWLAAGVGRLILDGALTPKIDFECNAFLEVSRLPPLSVDGTFATAGSVRSPYRTPYLTWDFWEEDEGRGQLGLDRFFLSLHTPPLQVSLGRMPINYSVTNIFTPNDFFAPFSPTAINKVYKPGVDAMRISLATGMLGSVELVGALGSDTDGVPALDMSALMARASLVRWNFQWALLGGRLAERWIAGGSLQGDVGRVGIRAEGHAGFPDPAGPGELRDASAYVHVAAGLDVPFTWRNAGVGADYMFLSDGADSPRGYILRAVALYPDDLVYLGKHYVGLSAGGEILPILRVNLLGLVNAGDGSGLAALMFLWNMMDEADLAAGVMLPWGAGPTAGGGPKALPEINSEFGLMPITVFLETRIYF